MKQTKTFRMSKIAAAVAFAVATPATMQLAYAGAGWGDSTNATPDANVSAKDNLGNMKVRTYYANSPQGLQADALTGAMTRDTGVPLRKFVDALPGLNVPGAAGTNITVAAPDKVAYPGADYYEIAVVEYTQRMHSDLLKATTLRGYVQIDPVATETAGASRSAPVTYLGLPFASQAIPLFQLDGTTPVMISRPDGNGGYVQKQAYAWAKPDYLGATIAAMHNTPTRIKFYNGLPSGHGAYVTDPITKAVTWHRNGDLFIPVDHTLFGGGDGQYQLAKGRDILCGDVMGGPNNAGDPTGSACLGGPNLDGTPDTPLGYVHVPAFEQYTENREELHLHGGDNPWLSDGHPHQWITPAADELAFNAAGKPNFARGDLAYNVPDMAEAGPGAVTYYYPNGQSGRLMFYHDHATGLTRLNVYTGTAAGYLLVDGPENTMMQTVLGLGALDAEGIPLVIQEKTFVPKDIATEDAKWDTEKWGKEGELWFPHVYETNQDPLSADATNPVGRWDGASFFWPVFPQIYATPSGEYGNASTTPEAFMDTPIVNGMAYPTMTVDPKPYRFRILGVGNDRLLNLSFYVADTATQNVNATAPAGQTYPAVVATGTEVKMVPFNSPNAQFGTTYACPTDGVSAPGTVLATPIQNAIGTITKWGWTESGPTLGGGAALYNTSFPCAGGLLDTGWGQADNRIGGVPDPTTMGPAFVRIGNEGGLFQAPVVIPPTPMNYEYNKRSVTVLNVQERGLWLGPAERADVVVDFSAYAGKTLILYNDSGAPVPAGDPRIDYYTGDGDQTGAGGAPNTVAGYGPNSRTIMQVKVNAGNGSPLDLTALTTAMLDTYKKTQPLPIVPTPEYAPLLGAAANAPYEHIYTGAIYLNKYNALTFPIAPEAFKYTPAPICSTTAKCLTELANIRKGPAGGLKDAVAGQPVAAYVESKAIQELFEADYGRMNATLGVELPFTNVTIQTTIPLAYVDPATETIAAGETQFWKITHNGVDTHPVHFHFINVQVINRVGWDGTIKTIPADEVGWKETVKMHPLEDVIIAVRAKTAPPTPFGMPHSYRQPAPNQLPTDNHGITQIDAATGNAPTVAYTNAYTDYGSEYVWHCHILGHEENDFMRPFIFKAGEVKSAAPTAVSGTGSTAGTVVSWTDPTPVPALLTSYDPMTGVGFLGNPNNEIGFRVERAPADVNGNPTGAYQPVGTGLHQINAITPKINALANATSYTDTTVAASAALPAPSAPVLASQNATSVTLTLPDFVGGTTGYDVYRNNGKIASNQPAGSFIDSTAVAGTAYSYTLIAVASTATQFSYQVVAVTAAGDSTPSNAFSVAGSAPTNSAPSAALNVLMAPVALAGLTVTNPTVSSLTVNWPAAPVIEAVTGYLVSTNGAAAVGATSPDLIGGLAANTSYSFTVAVINATGTGPASASVSGLTLPAAPTALTTGAITASTVALSWTAPAGGAAGYTVQVPVGASAVVNGTTAVVSGLAPNSNNSFTVVATNASGASVASNVVSAVTLPVAPTALTANAASMTSVTLAWAASLNGAASYTVQYSSNNGGIWTSLAPLAGTGTTVSGLLPSTTYLFQVVANNATGSSAASGQASATTPATTVAPSVPACCTTSNLTATSMTLNWTPSATGPAASYTVQRATNNTFTRGLQTTLNVAGTSLGFTGLTSGATYYFRVLAVNTVGSSAYSTPVFSQLMPTLPATPVAPTAAATAVSTAVPSANVTMPAAAAGVTYTVYQQSRLVGGATWVTAAAPIATGVAGLAVVPVAGLTPNTQYRFYLVAVNAAGSSANGQTSNTVTARQLANAPATTTATANAVGTRTITVNWTLGTANGAAVTGIQVQRATNAGFTAGLNTTNLAATALTTTTPRMVAGTTYYFRVAEVTAGGASVWGPVVSATAR